MSNELTVSKILDLAKEGWDTIVEIYKNSDKEEREKIIKALAGLIGFSALIKYLKSL